MAWRSSVILLNCLPRHAAFLFQRGDACFLQSLDVLRDLSCCSSVIPYRIPGMIPRCCNTVK
jgi:hypothetical protein